MLTILTCKGKHKQFGREIESEHQLILNWHTHSSSNPHTYTIITNDAKAKEIIENSKVFAVNFAQEESKLLEQCDNIDCPRLKNAKWLEWELMHSVQLGESTLFVGRIR